MWRKSSANALMGTLEFLKVTSDCLLESSASLGAPTHCFLLKGIWVHSLSSGSHVNHEKYRPFFCMWWKCSSLSVNSLVVYFGLAFSTLDSWLHLHELDITSCISSQACVNLGKHSWCFCRTALSPASLPTWLDFFLWRKSKIIDKKAPGTIKSL